MRNMKPRFESTSTEYKQLMKQAADLEERLEKAQQSQPEYKSKEGSEQNYEFMTHEAGKPNVRNQGFSTNNHLIESEDVKNKGSISEKSNVLDKNTFYPTVDNTERLVDGGSGPVLKSLGGDIEKFRLQEIRKSMDNISSRLN